MYLREALFLAKGKLNNNINYIKQNKKNVFLALSTIDNLQYIFKTRYKEITYLEISYIIKKS